MFIVACVECLAIAGLLVPGTVLLFAVGLKLDLHHIRHIGPVALAVTTNCSIDFMRKPVAGVDLLAECRLLKLGRVLAVADVLIIGAGASGCSEDSEMWYRIIATGGGAFMNDETRALILGGAIAIKLALDQPQRISRLVLMAPGGLARPGQPQPWIEGANVQGPFRLPGRTGGHGRFRLRCSGGRGRGRHKCRCD